MVGRPVHARVDERAKVVDEDVGRAIVDDVVVTAAERVQERTGRRLNERGAGIGRAPEDDALGIRSAAWNARR